MLRNLAAISALAVGQSAAPRPGGAPSKEEALKAIDFVAVKKDILELFTNSEGFWPADYGHYGGLFIRQSWHCSGSYRISDGRGGCDGGRQRFDPERSWQDNTNLDKARDLLMPIKQKYGFGLSWGDLQILTGTLAIENMGGPILGYCAGRNDDPDGSASLTLGPTAEQNMFHPCPVDGECTAPLGDTTLGLIYLNPEGHMGDYTTVDKETPNDIRDTFKRMAMNDTETVALIGGGHSFGKAHGPADCPNGPGPNPKEDPSNPWPGCYKTGKGEDAWTSGFEGPWTVNPREWGSGEYFKVLNANEWEPYEGNSTHYQWQVKGGPTPTTKSAQGTFMQNIMMMTSDVALKHDAEYNALVQKMSTDQAFFEDQFKHAWYKLTHRDMGPHSRCFTPEGLWPEVPAQDWQYPLPSPPVKTADFEAVADRIKKALKEDQAAILTPDLDQDDKPYYGAIFVQLAFQCASTYRGTDFLGGCNGARILLEPQSKWSGNVAMDKAWDLLASIQKDFPDLSAADLITLAGQVAVEGASGEKLEFCGGRTDAGADEGSQYLEPSEELHDFMTAGFFLRQRFSTMGLTNREGVALFGRMRSEVIQKMLGYTGSWTKDVSHLSNEFFNVLVNNTWLPFEYAPTAAPAPTAAVPTAAAPAPATPTAAALTAAAPTAAAPTAAAPTAGAPTAAAPTAASPAAAPTAAAPTADAPTADAPTAAAAPTAAPPTPVSGPTAASPTAPAPTMPPTPGGIVREFKALNADLYMTRDDVTIKYDSVLAAIAEEYAFNNDVFLAEFTSAWTKLANADQFKGPNNSRCAAPSPAPPAPIPAEDSGLSKGAVAGISVGGTLVGCMLLMAAYNVATKKKSEPEGYANLRG